MIYYSKTTKGFYCEEIHGTNIPSDCVQITKEQHTTLLNDQSQGKQIVPDQNGYPIAIIPPVAPPTWEQIKAQRDGLLKDSDWTTNSDAPFTAAQKKAWKEYRQALRDLPSTFSTPEEVVWPEKP